MKYDLHIHSKYSKDGVLEVKDIIKIAKKSGLSGIAITDHNSIKGGLKGKEYETEDFKVIVGSEIKTAQGEIIGLFISHEIKSNDIQSIVNEIRGQNGIIIVPHPFDEMRHSALNPTENDIDLIDAIEIFNSRCVFQKYNDIAYYFAEENKLGMTAGSDAHYANEIGKGGIISENEDIREAILSNDVEIFGSKSSIMNHGFTKVLKLCRKIKSG